MTMGVERTLTTGLPNGTSSRNEDERFEESFSSRSKYVLSSPFSELEEETYRFVEQVQLCLTVNGELLVWRKTSGMPTKYSLVRRHDIRSSQIVEHPFLPDAIRIQTGGTTSVNVYQLANDPSESSVKKWISKTSASRLLENKAKSRLTSIHANNTHSHINGPKAVAKKSLLPIKLGLSSSSSTKSKAAVSVDKAAKTQLTSSHGYSSPSSPVAQNRSILSAVLMSKSRMSSGSSLQEEKEENGGCRSQGSRDLEAAKDDGSTTCSSSSTIKQNDSSSVTDDEDGDLVVSNGYHGDEEHSFPLDKAALGNRTTEVVMFVNGPSDCTPELEEQEGNAKNGDEEKQDLDTNHLEIFVDFDVYDDDDEVDRSRFSREHRSSLRLDLKNKMSSEFTRTFSDRYLGHHRALSAIEEGAVLTTKYNRSSSSASKLDELKEGSRLSLKNDSLPRLNGETRSHGSVTPTSPPLTPTAPRTPSPLTPVPPPSSSPTPSFEGNGFLGRFHHMQIRNRKVKCSPRINRSISVQTPPPFEKISEMTTDRPSSSTAMLTSSLVVTARSGEITAMRSATPTHTSATSKALSSSSRHPSGCSTLPRSTKKQKNARPPSANSKDAKNSLTSSMGQFTPNSPVPAKHLPPKSPKLLRIFHRRWQSSSAIKVPLNLDDGMPDFSGSVPSTPTHGSSSQALKKLYLYDSQEVAEELSVLDSELLRKIDEEELRNGAWMKKEKDSLAPNVMAMVRSFNQLALLIPSEILEEKTPQGRAKVISAYIQIASKCYRLRNYNSLKAILAGLQCTPIFRLKKTWKEVPSKKRKRFEQLSTLMSESDNGQLYQTEIEKLLRTEEPFIPFLGYFLTQVVHQSSFDEIRAKREKSICSSASTVSIKSEDSQLPHTSPSRQILTRERNGLQVPKSVRATHRRSSSLMTSLLDKLKEEDATVLSKSAPSSPVPAHFDGLHYKEEHVLHERGEEEVDWAGHSENSLADHDSGLYSSSSRRSTSIPKSSSFNSLNNEGDVESALAVEDAGEERCSSAAMTATEGEVDLLEVYARLKRKSKSYESLLSAYTEEDKGMRNVIHSTLTELARLSANCDGDSVFSEDDFLGEHDTSSINLDFTNSDQCSDVSLHCDSLDASVSDSQLIHEHRAAMNDCIDTSPSRKGLTSLDKRLRGYDRPTTTSHDQTCERSPIKENTSEGDKNATQRRRILLRAQSEMTSLETKLSDMEREGSEGVREGSSEAPENSEGKREKGTKKKRSIQRSLSYSNSAGGKAAPKRRRRKKSSSVCNERLSSSDREKSAEPPTPPEMLNHFKIASLGCSVGLQSKTTLRTLICDTQPNAEKDNYRLSLDREQ